MRSAITFINSTDNSSHANGPEHNVVFCNEIIEQAEPPKYKDLALCGIKVSNSKEWTSFNNLSAWLGKGVMVEHLLTGGGRGAVGPTNLFPEIAYALLTDERIGAGKLIGAASVDKEAMELAAKFCQANNFLLGWRHCREPEPPGVHLLQCRLHSLRLHD